jgi:hypothetical protein
MADETQDDKAAKDAERKAAAEAKAKERAEAKAAKAAAAAEAKAARTAEQITKVVSSVEWDGDAPTFETVAEAREAVKNRRAEIRASRPKKAPLTLSQRRALLRLGDGDVVAKTDFNALPLQHLVSVGLAESFTGTVDEVVKETVEKEVKIPKAEQVEGGPTTKTVKEKVESTRQVERPGFRLTDEGKARVKEINPKWLEWKPAAKEEAPAA